MLALSCGPAKCCISTVAVVVYYRAKGLLKGQEMSGVVKNIKRFASLKAEGTQEVPGTPWRKVIYQGCRVREL